MTRVGMMQQEFEDSIDYWSEPPKSYPTPLEMAEYYHKTAGLDYEVDYSKGDNSDLARLRLNLISEEYEEVVGELKELVEFGAEDFDPAALLKELSDLIYVIYGTAVTFGWNLDEALYRVHSNNLGRMYQPDGSIKRHENGKIVKNPDYPKVDLGDLV